MRTFITVSTKSRLWTLTRTICAPTLHYISLRSIFSLLFICLKIKKAGDQFFPDLLTCLISCCCVMRFAVRINVYIVDCPLLKPYWSSLLKFSPCCVPSNYFVFCVVHVVSRRRMRSLCHLCTPPICSFLMLSVSYERKVCD
jgi:hypothetical protein